MNVGETVTLSVRNPLWDRRSVYACPMFEVTTYTGKILPNPRWVASDCLCLSTGDTQFPFRVIELARVVGLALPPAESRQKKTETFIVSGSKAGSSYTVTRDGGHWSCTCVGFGFRKDCKHVKECKAA